MERGELRHGAKRGVFFDFDSTMTTPIKLPRFHRHAIADSPEIFASMTPQEILANFGGRPRLQRMGKLLQALTEAGCELLLDADCAVHVISADDPVSPRETLFLRRLGTGLETVWMWRMARCVRARNGL
ncbi:unnamed protein product, partial [Durusdinium trenchii]